MALEEEPRIVARGSWAQDEQGDLIYGPEGLPPLVAERLTEATQSLWAEGPSEQGRGYRIRTKDLWDQAKIDYLAGDTARAVCERYGLSESTLKDRAKKGHWRKCDQPDPHPIDDALDDDAPAPDLGLMAARALLRADRAIERGRAAEAASWLRLHARLTDMPDRTPATPTPTPAPTEPDPFEAFERKNLAIIALANQLAETDDSDPIASAAVEAQFEAFRAEFEREFPDYSDDSDPVFSAPGSETPIADDAPP